MSGRNLSHAAPLQAHNMKSRDMLNSHGPGWEINHPSAHCTHSSPLGWSRILWVETAGLRLFFGVLCLLVVWGGNAAGKEVLVRKVETG